MKKVSMNLLPSMWWVFVFPLSVVISCALSPRAYKIENLSSPSSYVERGKAYCEKKDFERAVA